MDWPAEVEDGLEELGLNDRFDKRIWSERNVRNPKKAVIDSSMKREVRLVERGICPDARAW